MNLNHSTQIKTSKWKMANHRNQLHDEN